MTLPVFFRRIKVLAHTSLEGCDTTWLVLVMSSMSADLLLQCNALGACAA